MFRTKRRYDEAGLDEVLRHHNRVNRPTYWASQVKYSMARVCIAS